MRVVLAVAAIGGVWLFAWLVAPWIRLGALWLWHALCQLIAYMLLFWFVTGLLPRPWGQRLRRLVWWIIHCVIRFLGNLVG